MKKSRNRFIIWTNKNYLEKNFNSQKFLFFKSIKEIPNKTGVYFIDTDLQPVQWFKESVDLCRQKPSEYGIVTGPLEKKSFQDIKSLGHTEYLRQEFPDKNLFMTFFGDLYNCLLLTDHCSLKDVSKRLNEELITRGLKESLLLKNKT